MLTHIAIKGFKSLVDVSLDLPRLAVVFGPNDAGKSNFIDALQILSRIATEKTVTEALSGPIRGYSWEQFSLPPGGFKEMVEQPEVSFRFQTKLEQKRSPGTDSELIQVDYNIEIIISPDTGNLAFGEEYLLEHKEVLGEPNWRSIARKNNKMYMASNPSEKNAPRLEAPMQLSPNASMLTRLRFEGPELAVNAFDWIDFASWQVYYLDPRLAMREPSPAKEVKDIGPHGENLSPFLNRLAKEQEPLFGAIIRNLHLIIPTIDDVVVKLDENQGTLDLRVIEDGTPYSVRIVSEGTLRVLALCAIAVNPWGGALVAIEEPENGVHPRRLDTIVNLLKFMAFERGRQVIITTHSPRLISLMNKLALEKPEEVGMFACRREHRATVIKRFQPVSGLMEDKEILAALESDREDRLIEAMLLRGWIDG